MRFRLCRVAPIKRAILRLGRGERVRCSLATFRGNDIFRFSLKFFAKVRPYVALTRSLFPARSRANAFTPRPVDKEKKKMKYRVYVCETSNLSFAKNGIDAERCLSLLPCHKSFRKQSLLLIPDSITVTFRKRPAATRSK